MTDYHIHIFSSEEDGGSVADIPVPQYRPARYG
jgi:hypothetical protein